MWVRNTYMVFLIFGKESQLMNTCSARQKQILPAIIQNKTQQRNWHRKPTPRPFYRQFVVYFSLNLIASNRIFLKVVLDSKITLALQVISTNLSKFHFQILHVLILWLKEGILYAFKKIQYYRKIYTAGTLKRRNLTAAVGYHPAGVRIWYWYRLDLQNWSGKWICARLSSHSIFFCVKCSLRVFFRQKVPQILIINGNIFYTQQNY